MSAAKTVLWYGIFSGVGLALFACIIGATYIVGITTEQAGYASLALLACSAIVPLIGIALSAVAYVIER